MNIGKINFGPSLNHSFLGFDRLFNDLEKFNQEALECSVTYPPHNIKQHPDDINKYVIEIAISGFVEEDIDIAMANNVLTVIGKKKNKDDGKYLYKGIGVRNFNKVFRLYESIVVHSAQYENGILSIYLENVVPESMKPRKILINNQQQLLTE